MHRDDDDGRLGPLHEPRRHDADDAGVPILTADDEHAVPGAGGVGLQRLQLGGRTLLFGLLARSVLISAFSYAGGLILVALPSSSLTLPAALSMARSVQARGQTVADRVRRRQTCRRSRRSPKARAGRGASCPAKGTMLSLMSAKATSGSIIQNSARWREVFEFSRRKSRSTRRCRSSADAMMLTRFAELTGNRKIGGFAEEVFAEVDAPLS